ncbi:MAG: glycosyltransferase [bacterium]
MKPVICLLASAKNIHTVRWAASLAERGYDVHIVSFVDNTIPGIRVHCLASDFNIRGNGFYKIVYCFKEIRQLRRIIADLKPAILHAHYITSYGLLGALTRFYPFVGSLWGSDVFEFPNRSPFHRMMIKFVLSRCDYLCATSWALKNEAEKYTKKEITLTPFGVDCQKLKPVLPGNCDDAFCIGTIKSLEDCYGIDILIDAFGVLVNRNRGKKLKLMIVGEGSLRKTLEEMAKNLGLADKVKFIGKVEHSLVPAYLNQIDVFVALSRRESFGVAVLEASACGIPVVVSNVGGLPEVVEDGHTGIIVPPDDRNAAAIALEKIMLNSQLRLNLGAAGREFVLKKYDWNSNVTQMVKLYNEILKVYPRTNSQHKYLLQNRYPLKKSPPESGR